MATDLQHEALGIRAVLELTADESPCFRPPPPEYSYLETLGWERSQSRRRIEWLRQKLAEVAERLEALGKEEA